MARPRSELSVVLNEIVENVYFQPPTNTQMKFPCITYEPARPDVRHAGNLPYANTKQYTVTVITKDADSDIPDTVAALPMCSFSTFFVSNQHYHHVFDIFF